MTALKAPARRVRVGIDGRVLSDDYHGIGRVADALVRELAGMAGVEVVLALGNKGTYRFDVDALLALPNVDSFRFNVPLTSARQILSWPAALRRAQVDFMVFPYHLGAPITGHGPRLVMVHDCILESRADFAPPGWRRTAYRVLTTAVTHTNSVITPSQTSADEVRQYYRLGANDVDVVFNGVEQKFFGPTNEQTSTWVSRNLPERYLLQVGARRPHKNLAVLVRMLRDLPDRHLVLVGGADKRFIDLVPALAERLGVSDRVHHVPFVPEEHLVGVYRHADALVYPSLIEGFGLPMLEAMAAGIPVIASDIPVFAELAKNAAVLVPTDSPSAWSEAVNQVLGQPDLRTALIERGREVASGYTWRRSAHSLLTAAFKALGSAPPMAQSPSSTAVMGLLSGS